MAEERKPEKKKKKKKKVLRRVIVTLLILTVLSGAGLYAWARLKSEYTITYNEYTATTGSISNSLSFSGTLALRDSATYTASAAGTVRGVYVSEGDEVKKGDKLARLSTGTYFTADFDGKVNVVAVGEGDSVNAGDTLVQIADFSHLKVSFRIDEYDISDVAVGDSCRVVATAAEKTFRSRVESINYISSSSGNVAYYTATAYVDVDDGVYPGMQVTVTIPQEEAVNVVILKEEALSFSDRNRAFVYMMGEDEKMTEVGVEVGVSNGNYVEIRSGLRDGDVVYAVTKQEASNSLASLFSGIFGGQRINNTNRQNTNRNSWTNNNQNQNRPGGNMPSGGGTGGGR